MKPIILSVVRYLQTLNRANSDRHTTENQNTIEIEAVM